MEDLTPRKQDLDPIEIASRDEIEELLEEGIMVLPVPPLDDELH